MDDLDHSVHISDCDWEKFYEESEECSLQQPSLACLDDPNLSDSEDSGDPVCPALDTEQYKLEQGTDKIFALSQANTEEHGKAEQGFAECVTDKGNTFLGYNVVADTALKSQEATKMNVESFKDISLATELVQCKDYLGMTVVTTHISNDQESVAKNANIKLANGQHAASVGDPSESVQVKGVNDVTQSESGTPSTSPTCLINRSESPSGQHTKSNVNLDSTVGTAHDKNSNNIPWTEKERWFVTVNDSPTPKHAFTATPLKKKRRKKKLHRNSVRKEGLTDGQVEPLSQIFPELEKEEVFESEGEDEMEYLTQPNIYSGPHRSPHIVSLQGGLASELQHKTFPPFGKKESASTKLTLQKIYVTSECPTESSFDINICNSHDTGVNLLNPVYPISALNDTLVQREDNTKGTENLEESDDLENEVKFFSTNSYGDSDDYLSAAELPEECKELLPDSLNEIQPVSLSNTQCTISLTTENSLFLSMDDVHNTKDVQMYSHDIQDTHSSLLSSEAAYSEDMLENDSLCSFMQEQNEGYPCTADQAYIEPTIMPNDTNDTLMHADYKPSSTLQECSETDKMNEPLTGCRTLAPGDNPKSPTPPPEVTVTPCSLPESPETYVNALSHPRPVYAISAFWDEMEKLTIKDILQLRVARSPSPGEMLDLPGMSTVQGEATHTNVHDSYSGDTAEYSLPDSTLADVSDNADSDYFTNLDDSKPDRSSCEFSSLSDFDEDCLRLIGASTNPSPEPQDMKLQSHPESPSGYSSNFIQEGDIKQAGQGTSVDANHLVQQTFEDTILNVNLSGNSTCRKGLTKSKSMHNVQALSVEIELKDASLHSILEEEEQSLFLSSCQALERDTFMRMCDTIMPKTRTPPPILANAHIQDEHYQISFPEVFEYLFTEGEPTNVSRTVTVYDSNSVLNSHSYDGSEMLLLPLQRKPVPIFSCSPSAVRDATFPELEYLLLPQETHVESEEEEDSSPIRVWTRSDIQNSECTYSGATDQNYYSKEYHRNCNSLFSMRKCCFPCKGSSWCRRSGAWVYPADAQRTMISIKTSNPAIKLDDEEKVTSLAPQLIQFGQTIFRDLAERQRKLNILQKTVSISNRDDIFFTLKHSDMCLVCIAFASWVLRSSDPQATDAWKAALLANVSAISAIQYLRRYVKKDQPEEKP